MTSDISLEELHAFAAKLGLRREWFDGGRYPHYDLTGGKCTEAIRLGAEVVTQRDVVAAAKRLAAAEVAKP